MQESQDGKCPYCSSASVAYVRYSAVDDVVVYRCWEDTCMGKFFMSLIGMLA